MRSIYKMSNFLLFLFSFYWFGLNTKHSHFWRVNVTPNAIGVLLIWRSNVLWKKTAFLFNMWMWRGLGQFVVNSAKSWAKCFIVALKPGTAHHISLPGVWYERFPWILILKLVQQNLEMSYTLSKHKRHCFVIGNQQAFISASIWWMKGHA